MEKYGVVTKKVATCPICGEELISSNPPTCPVHGTLGMEKKADDEEDEEED